MTIPALDRLIQQLQTLETKFDELMLSLMAGQIPVKLTKAARIEGAKVEAPTPQLKLSESKFIQVYNEIPVLLKAYTIAVDWTIDSYQNPQRPPLILEPVNNSNYWVIPVLVADTITYWLVPNPLRQIRFDRLERLSYLFDYPLLDRVNKDSEFHLIAPATVSYYFDTGVTKWKLEQQGKLAVTGGATAQSDSVQLIKALQQQVRRQEATLQQLQQQMAQLLSGNRFNSIEDRNIPSTIEDSKIASLDLISPWRNPQLTNSLKSQKGTIKSIALTRWQGNNKLILFASTHSGKIEVWDLESGKFIYDITRTEELLSDVPTIAIVPQKQILISTTENHQIKARYISEGKEYIYGQHDEWILSLALSTDSTYLATGDRQGIVKIWDTEQKSQIQTIEHGNPILYMVITPDRQYLIAVDAQQQILFWLMKTAQLHTVKPLADLVRSIAISPNGKYLALGFQNGNVQIWDAQKFTVKHNLTQLHQQVWSLTFDPRSQILVSGGSDTSLCLWDAATGNLICQPSGGQNSIYALTFSPDGKTLVAAGADGIIDLWTEARSIV
jgi:WD40 repeat protein